MSYFLKWLFFPNWEVIWYRRGRWQLVNNFTENKIVDERYANYHISYSKVRKKYKLTSSGHDCEIHQMYGEAVKELIRLRKDEPYRY